MTGNLLKMRCLKGKPIKYFLPLSEDEVAMNVLIGRNIRVEYKHKINCIRCGRITQKSFAQGYCYPCFQSAPETEECVLRPELCLAHKGIARDMEFANNHCLIDHIVYISFTGNIKVGVTRHTQIPTRWIDQGATAAIIIARTPNRYTAGIIEVTLKNIMSDKTNWRNMLRDRTSNIDLSSAKDKAYQYLGNDLRSYFKNESETEYIEYPCIKVPDKITSINLDKNPVAEGVLNGIRGQYLIFEDGRVINIRKYGGYFVDFTA